MRERRRVDDHQVREPPREARVARQRRPIREHDPRARYGYPRHGGGHRGVPEPRRDDRELATPEPRRTGRPLDQLASSNRVGADRQHRLAAGGERGNRRDARAVAAIDHEALGRGVGAGGRPVREPALELGVVAPPELIVGDRLCRPLGGGRRSLDRVELAEHDPGLDRSVPVVELEPDRDVLRAADGRVERAVDAERDPERTSTPAREPEPGVAVAVAHRPHVAEPRPGNQQADARIALAERGQAP